MVQMKVADHHGIDYLVKIAFRGQILEVWESPLILVYRTAIDQHQDLKWGLN